MNACPICLTPSILKGAEPHQIVECPRCGIWSAWIIDGHRRISISDLVSPYGEDKPIRRANFSRLVRRLKRPGQDITSFQTKNIDPERLDDPLPSPAEHLDSLVLWLGERQKVAGIAAALRSDEISAWIGAPINPHDRFGPLAWLLTQPETQDLVEVAGSGDGDPIALTFRGWLRRDELLHKSRASRSAFMAMKFGDDVMQQVFANCFRPAVADAGFELRTALDGQPAGLIDDQLRISLRQAKFVLADLTHANNGAYWEAGFAEGAGKKVIYTCGAQVWATQKTHFDTNHLATIVWDTSDLADAQKRLTAMIGATFPEEASIS